MRVTRPGALLGWLSARAATARRSRFIRSSAGIGGLIVAELALGLVTAILLARALGAEGLGVYSLVLAAVGHCQRKIDYFARTPNWHFAAIDIPRFFRIDPSGSTATSSI